MDSDFVIEIEKLGCKAGYRYLLKDVNWQVARGEHWVVFGMNGSGKTTLLSIIAGYKHFSEGKVWLFGQLFDNKNILAFRKKIGWVSSSFFDKHYSKESVLDIVLSGKCGALGLCANLDLNDVVFAKEMLGDLGLGDKINRGFDMLSKGERQNVLIARAMFSQPEILILDEPCSGLDVYNRNYLFNTLEALGRVKDLTIIYVTHYAEEIMPIFDKALFLKNGRVLAQGEMAALFREALLEEMIENPVEIAREHSGRYRIDVQTTSSLTHVLERRKMR